MSDKAESPLLRLPGELRKMIYKRVLCPQRVVNLVLKEPKDFELISPVPKLGEPKNPRESGPSLRIAGKPRLGRTLEVLQREKCVDTANHLRTYDISSAVLLACKLSYTEAAPLLYSENTFCVYAELLPFMYGMLASVGSINSHSIRFLHIHYFRAAIVDLWTGLMVDRNPLVELCRQLPGLQELKIWRPQEDLDDEFRDQNIVHVDLNDYHQASREAASRIFTLALQGVKSLKSTDFASGIVLAGPEHSFSYDNIAYPWATLPNPLRVTAYLNLPAVRRAIHAPKKDIIACNATAQATLLPHQVTPPVEQVLPYLSAKGSKVHIWSGGWDFLLPHMGTELAIQRMLWGGKHGLQRPPKNRLVVHGRVVGNWGAERNLPYHRILRAGHSVPFDRPAVALIYVWDFVLGEAGYYARYPL